MRTYGKKKEFFAVSVMEVDCFYTRLAHELAGCNPNTYQPKTRTNTKRKADDAVDEQRQVLNAILAEQAAQRTMLNRLIVNQVYGSV